MDLSDSDPQLVYASDTVGKVNEPELRVWKLFSGRFFRFLYADDRIEFLLDRSGSQIWANWPASVPIEDTATYLLGPVMGFVLRLRDVVCLHASAVAVRGRAVALVGPGEAGKSTTAAAFAQLGFPVLSDDIVALEERVSGLAVHPGNPRLRLWPDSVSRLFGSPDALPRLIPNWEKCYLDLNDSTFSFQSQGLPLGAVYVLGPRRDDISAPHANALDDREGLLALVANSYSNYLLDSGMRGREFELLGKLMRSVPVRQVTAHASSALLPKLCQVIVDDLQHLTEPDRFGERRAEC